MTLLRTLDASAYTGEIAPAAWPALRSSGISVFIPQIWGGPSGPNPYLAQHVAGARAGGLRVPGGYVWPPSRWADALTHWRAQLGDPLPAAVWLDVEAGAGFDGAMVSGLAMAGVQPGNYCSPSTWREIMGNTTAFLNLPTWLATYRSGDWPASLPTFAYGRVVGWQWQGTTTLLDESYDLSVFDAGFIQALQEQEDDMATDPIDKTRIERLCWLAVHGGPGAIDEYVDDSHMPRTYTQEVKETVDATMAALHQLATRVTQLEAKVAAVPTGSGQLTPQQVASIKAIIAGSKVTPPQ